VRAFSGLRLRSKGKETITVMDTRTGSIAGTITINVT
jgi:hypothetical protein